MAQSNSAFTRAASLAQLVLALGTTIVTEGRHHAPGEGKGRGEFYAVAICRWEKPRMDVRMGRQTALPRVSITEWLRSTDPSRYCIYRQLVAVAIYSF